MPEFCGFRHELFCFAQVFRFRSGPLAVRYEPMPGWQSAVSATFIVQIAVSIFLGILFLQSGIDKIVDRRGNLDWLTGHFAKSPLGPIVPLLLLAMTILELAAGLFSAIGCVLLVINRSAACAFYGAVLSSAAIIALFFGQRMAKDYPGAAVLVSYFLLTLVAIYVLSL